MQKACEVPLVSSQIAAAAEEPRPRPAQLITSDETSAMLPSIHCWRPGHEADKALIAVLPSSKESRHDRLLNEALAGDHAAFSEICRHYSPRILRTVCRITRNREDAEDALQDALMRAFIHLRSFDRRAHFCTWLTKIATNSALIILRKRKRHIQVSTDDFGEHYERFLTREVVDPHLDPELHFLENEQAEQLQQGIVALNSRLRKALEMWIVQEASAKEGARHLKISTAAFKTRVTRAKAALQADLGSRRRKLDRTGPRYDRRLPVRRIPK